MTNETLKKVLQDFFDWIESATVDSYYKAVKGSKHDGGRNSAFHEVRNLILKVAKDYGVEIEE